MADKPLILVVDDTRSDALLLGGAVSKAGYESVVAADGEDAVRLAVEKRPDLILLDMTMPGLDGIATCRALKSNPATAHVPVIFVTAHNDSSHAVTAFAAGGSDYVTKPIRIDELLARVSVQLRLRQAENSLLERNSQLEYLTRQLAETNEALHRQSRLDGLTGLLNRGAWDEAAQREVERSQRHNHAYCVLLIDVDQFKSFNDSLGHQEGDGCLKQVAGVIASTCRTTDLVGRYGGEEFIVLAPETSGDAAMRLGERIRQGVWNLCLRHPCSPAGRVTLSVGVAGNEQGTLAGVMRSADAYLYRAKNAGRNLVFGRDTIAYASPTLDRPDAPAASAASLEPSVATPATILVVDDNRTNRLVHRNCLEKEGHRVVEAESGAAAMEVVEKNPPQVILMDVMMPGMDGIECTRRLKAAVETRDIPIVIVSARDDSKTVLAGLQAGAEEYLTKPVRMLELVARVRSMLRLSDERRDLLRSYRLRAEQIRLLTVLVDLCPTLGNASTTEEILDSTLAAVAEITCCHRLAALLPDADEAHLTVARSIHIAPAEAAMVRVAMGEGVVGRVWAQREAVIVNPVPLENTIPPWTHNESPVAGLPMMAAPLGSPERMLGVLVVTDRVDQRPIAALELEYVDLVSRIAGSALHTLRYRKARDEARDLVVSALAGLAESRDNDTGHHVERVTQFACMLAESLRANGRFTDAIDDRFVRCLRRAVPLHDIGKVAIPDAILLKPERLSLEEMRIMRTHVDIGAETLRPIVGRVADADFLRMALDIIRAHHEWYDGSGYPQGLRGESIPLAARIVAVADVYDALVSDRIYRGAMPFEQAERMIAELSGTQFDPAVVDVFVQRANEFRALAGKLTDPLTKQANPRPSRATLATDPVADESPLPIP